MTGGSLATEMNMMVEGSMGSICAAVGRGERQERNTQAHTQCTVEGKLDDVYLMFNHGTLSAQTRLWLLGVLNTDFNAEIHPARHLLFNRHVINLYR